MYRDRGTSVRKVGLVENIGHDGTVLVKSSQPVRVGQSLVDSRNRPIGRVLRMFGPVAAPFLSLRPAGKVPLGLVGQPVFLEREA